MTSELLLPAAITSLKKLFLVCVFPRRTWKALGPERPYDTAVCWGILVLIASVRVWYPLIVHSKRLLIGPALDNAQPLLAVGIDSCIDGLLVLLGALVASLLVRFLAPQFQGTSCGSQPLKLITYSSLPVFLVSSTRILSAQQVLSISFWVWHCIVWGWSVVLLYEGSVVMTTVAPAKRSSFLAGFVASALLLYVSLGILGLALKAWL